MASQSFSTSGLTPSSIIFFNLSLSIIITLLSFTTGIPVTAWLNQTDFYKKNLYSLNFIRNEKLNHWLVMSLVKQMLTKTSLKRFNQKIKLTGVADRQTLLYMMAEMITAEIVHMVGFLIVCIVVIVRLFLGNWQFAIILVLPNILMNLYPTLTQQQNKRRLQKIM